MSMVRALIFVIDGPGGIVDGGFDG